MRTTGVIEEAFAESFLRVGGSIHDDLRQQLAHKERLQKWWESSAGGERMYAHTESWENPCLERLLAIPRKEVTFIEGGPFPALSACRRFSG
eukprot:s5277_g1.t1